MGILDNLKSWMTRSKGSLNQRTQTVTWDDGVKNYTSGYITSIAAFIGKELSKVQIDHKIYKPSDTGTGFVSSDKLGSEIFEVLNYKPNGQSSNTTWKREIGRRLALGYTVYLVPKRSGYTLKSLEIGTVDDYNRAPDDVIILTSPITISSSASLYDSILTSVAQQLDTKKLKGFIRINATLENSDDFKRKAKNYIQTLQETSGYNGLGILDGKGEVRELNHEYTPIDPEMVSLIKKEILSGYGFAESLLTGTYTTEEYNHFFESVMAPIFQDFEKELTYKLLTTQARVNSGSKKSFERLTISSSSLKYSSADTLIKLAEVNVNSALLTVNEMRKLLGFDTVDGGDSFRTNLNSQEVTYDAKEGESDG